ncbi:tyrosine-type recombinase/integrase [Clostridiaceae bacterium Marseille-Q4143]|nr:tyrosine-type recombinase/integrase [Clostridiaceae bacterium Marseille-Q4143]
MRDLMQELEKYGIINKSDVLEQLEKMKTQELLNKHTYEIWESKDGKWRTYLPDPKKGRRLIKKTKRENVEKEIINYYKKEEQDKVKTFKDCYLHWRSVHDELVSDNSVYRYETDYKRYFDKTKFENMEMTDIKEDDITLFMLNKIRELKLCQKACKTLFWYISSVCLNALKNKVIVENPCLFLSANKFYQYCTVHERKREKVLVSDYEMNMLFEQIYDDYNNQPEYIPTYAVHMAVLTGMRVGEISALTWDSIYDNFILIEKSEKYNRKTKEYYVADTKNKKVRKFPLTDEIKSLLDKVKRVEMENGYLTKWVFSNEDGRVHAPVISSCVKNKCRQLGIEEKGIHAFRRTLNSKMRCNNVPAVIASEIMGHTESVNDEYYTYDITDMNTKRDIISQINRRIS